MAANYIARDPYELIFDAMKSEVPTFDGSNPEGWLSQVNRLFDFHNTPEDWRLRLVSYHMEGVADDWLLQSLANNQLSSWPEFQFRLRQYFGCPSDEPLFAKLVKDIETRIANLDSRRRKIPIPSESIELKLKKASEIHSSTNTELAAQPHFEEISEVNDKLGPEVFDKMSERTWNFFREMGSMQLDTSSSGFIVLNENTNIDEGKRLKKLDAGIQIARQAPKMLNELVEGVLRFSKEVVVSVTLRGAINYLMEGKRMGGQVRSRDSWSFLFDENNNEMTWCFDPGGSNFYISILPVGHSLLVLLLSYYSFRDLIFILIFWWFPGDKNVKLNVAFGCFGNFDATTSEYRGKIDIMINGKYMVVGILENALQSWLVGGGNVIFSLLQDRAFRLRVQLHHSLRALIPLISSQGTCFDMAQDGVRVHGALQVRRHMKFVWLLLSTYFLSTKLPEELPGLNYLMTFSTEVNRLLGSLPSCHGKWKFKLMMHLKLVRVGSLSMETMILDFIFLLLGCFWPFDPGILELIPIIFQPSPWSISLWPICFAPSLCFRSRKSVETSTRGRTPNAAAAPEHSTGGI